MFVAQYYNVWCCIGGTCLFTFLGYIIVQHTDFNNSHSKLQVVPGNTVWKTFGMVIIKYLITINIIYLSVNSRPIHYYLCHQQIFSASFSKIILAARRHWASAPCSPLGLVVAVSVWPVVTGIGGVANLGRWLELGELLRGPRSNHSATLAHRRINAVQPHLIPASRDIGYS